MGKQETSLHVQRRSGLSKHYEQPLFKQSLQLCTVVFVALLEKKYCESQQRLFHHDPVKAAGYWRTERLKNGVQDGAVIHYEQEKKTLIWNTSYQI